ncbi:MAG: 50S ribosomal protein L23 [Thermoplasmata archaeon]|nr:50S ribosomal protein L23 [Thermoplasmata archaeon]
MRKVLLHPYVTEKTMNLMSGTPTQDLTDGNRLEFVVRRDATKNQIRREFEQKFEVKVEKVNIKNSKHGKRAIIKLAEGYSAEDIGMRIGIF